MSRTTARRIRLGWRGSTVLATLAAAILMTSGWLPFAAADQVPAPPVPAAPATQTIKGDVLNIEGEQVVVKDISGHEVQVRVSKETRMDRLKVGDKVSATVAADGHAESIEVQTPQATK